MNLLQFFQLLLRIKNNFQLTNLIGFQVDGTIQSNIENNGAQHDIFQTDIFQQPQTDASSSQLVQTVARDEPNRSTVEADNEGTVRMQFSIKFLYRCFQ